MRFFACPFCLELLLGFVQCKPAVRLLILTISKVFLQVCVAFSCLNDPVDDPKQEAHFKKQIYTPTDVLNMTDVTMRRLVNATKKLPAFNDLSQNGKFALLKSKHSLSAKFYVTNV